ncbi:MAG: LysE family translocator [Marinovum sp.]|nr:LysE family translocator [Marinovum sp.]
MDLSVFLALASFAFVTVITPGPNNLMLMASGLNFGLRRSVPHMAGIGIGFPLMVLLVGLGAMEVFDAWPPSHTILKVLSVVYMVWLAWKIATAAPPREGAANGKPLTFLQAAAFQWVNPKAWSMALGAITLYATGRDLLSVLIVAGLYVACAVVSTSTWVLLGIQIRKLLGRPDVLRWVNFAMAMMLLGSLTIALLTPST